MASGCYSNEGREFVLLIYDNSLLIVSVFVSVFYSIIDTLVHYVTTNFIDIFKLILKEPLHLIIINSLLDFHHLQ